METWKQRSIWNLETRHGRGRNVIVPQRHPECCDNEDETRAVDSKWEQFNSVGREVRGCSLVGRRDFGSTRLHRLTRIMQRKRRLRNPTDSLSLISPSWAPPAYPAPSVPSLQIPVLFLFFNIYYLFLTVYFILFYFIFNFIKNNFFIG